MTKMTLTNNQHPAGQCVLAGVDGEGPFLMLHGEVTEVHVKRALSHLGDTNFKMEFNSEELESLEDLDFTLAMQLLKLGTADEVKKHLVPVKKKTTTQKVKETVTAVTSMVTPTTTNDQSTDEADSADDSA